MIRTFIFLLLPSFWGQAQQTVGIFKNESTAFPGYTLFGNNETTYLIDNCGDIVNTWQSNYKPGQSMYLLENGNLLRTAKIGQNAFDSPGGLGGRFELFSWEGDLLWSYEYANNIVHAHHDIAPLPNGNFLAIAWEKHSEPDARQNGRKYKGEVWSEKIVELEMVGFNQANIIWEWRLWDHLIQDYDPASNNFGVIADHPELVDINFIEEGEATSGNWVHLNAIDYNEDLDQIILSSRLFSEIWIIDHSTTTTEAAGSTGGKSGKGGDLLYRFGNPQTFDQGTSVDQLFAHQHAVNWIPKGYPQESKLMVFNNDKGEGASSIAIWTPAFDENGNYLMNPQEVLGPLIDWEYVKAGFYSRFMSSAQMLANGNIFICEGMNGRFFEINSDKEIVWEYINPVNSNGFPTSQGGTIRQNQTFRATRYGLDYSAFFNRDMNPKGPVETNSWDLNCQLQESSPVSTFENEKGADIKILGNVVKDFLALNIEGIDTAIYVRIFNLKGQLNQQFLLNNGQHLIDVSGLSKGVHCIVFKSRNVYYPTQKIVKY